jgi:hypothetical protein
MEKVVDLFAGCGGMSLASKWQDLKQYMSMNFLAIIAPNLSVNITKVQPCRI